MKIMPKCMNGKVRSKDKIKSEVSILSQMNHPNIAKLVRCFENDQNIYIMLELCENKSMVDLLRARRRLTETETRCYIAQLVEGLKHIHGKRIVHRDLKLGNLFIGSNMQLKIGDFGLSEKINDNNDKLKALSGTPNYIAPEILTCKEGHSFEVDIWAIGVIAYTLIVGVPPFQSKTSKATCSKIKQVLYSYPLTLNLSNQFKDFISQLLQKDPSHRLTLDQIYEHPFMKQPYPELCPVSTLYEPLYESRR
jgi:serine/threonine protein kinase